MTIKEFQKTHYIVAQHFAKHESDFSLDLTKLPKYTNELNLNRLKKFGKPYENFQDLVVSANIRYVVFDVNGTETDFDSLQDLKNYIKNS